MTARILAALVLIACVAACAAPPDEDARVAAVGPDRAAFDAVHPLLQRSCGTLDCHGVAARNWPSWGYGGLRLDPADTPDGRPSTAAEIDRTYRALVGLEPEKSAGLVTGAPPETTTFYRKALELESHKGGRRIAPGSDADRCLRGFLSGAADPAACTRAGAAF